MTPNEDLKFDDNYRIYCVVADTVQTNLERGACPESIVELRPDYDDKVTIHVKGGYTLRPTKDTQSVAQPRGRQIAQACHAVSMIREMKFRQFVRQQLQSGAALKSEMRLWDTRPQPITTIILSARDSFELDHVHQLMFGRDIDTGVFTDTNDEAYGVGEQVRTAFATEPIPATLTVGALDYLPLWGK